MLTRMTFLGVSRDNVGVRRRHTTARDATTDDDRRRLARHVQKTFRHLLRRANRTRGGDERRQERREFDGESRGEILVSTIVRW